MSTSRQVCISSRLATTISVNNKKINRFFFFKQRKETSGSVHSLLCLLPHSVQVLISLLDLCSSLVTAVLVFNAILLKPLKMVQLKGMAPPTFLTLQVKSLTRHSRPQPVPMSLASSFLLLSSPSYFHVSVLLKLLLLPQNIPGCHLSCLYLPLLILFSLPEITVTSNSHYTFPKSQAATVLNHTSDSPISFLTQ